MKLVKTSGKMLIVDQKSTRNLFQNTRNLESPNNDKHLQIFRSMKNIECLEFKHHEMFI